MHLRNGKLKKKNPFGNCMTNIMVVGTGLRRKEIDMMARFFRFWNLMEVNELGAKLERT